MYTQSGRSMVEMLGVLAIIGVLSVGAIAGYSKAMMKYKLNKHAEGFNILLNNALQFEGKLSFTPNNITFYGDMFKKLNLIPEGFKYYSNYYITDTFGNLIWIYHHDNLNGAGLHFSAIGYNFQPTSQGVELCRNIVITAKENSANLSRINTNKGHSDGTVTENVGNIFGDKYCNNSDKPCLYNLTLDKIANLCNICDESACSIYIVWE
jgi:Tfp pilus assembly protein PilE